MTKLRIGVTFVGTLVLALAVVLNIPGTVARQEQPSMIIPPSPAAAESVKIHFLSTATIDTPEAFAFAQGSLFKTFAMVHGAILIQHGNASLLFDSGLGRSADQQFAQDMPAWLKPFMAYRKGVAAVDQIRTLGLPSPKRIFLSHAHWDHASGLLDFPEAETWVTAAEHAYLRTPDARKGGQVFPTQVDSAAIRWHDYSLENAPYAGFEKSYDIYGDGTLVLVSLAGHSPGSVGLFVNSQDGQRRFFIGDAVWSVRAIEKSRHKFWVSSRLLDNNREATGHIIAKLELLMRSNPQLKVIPAHDLSAWR